ATGALVSFRTGAKQEGRDQGAAHEGGGRGRMEIMWNGEVPPAEQLHGRAEANSVPEIDEPAAIALDGKGRHARFGAAPSGRFAGFFRRDDFVVRHALQAPMINAENVMPAQAGIQ